MSPELQFALIALAVWRVTHLLSEEDGPGDLILRVRARLGRSALGRALDCFQCLSVWIAAPSALLVARDALSWGLTWLALSGAACLLERLRASGVGPQSPRARPFVVGGSHGMLWARTSGAPRGAGGEPAAAGGESIAAAPGPTAGRASG